MSKCKNFLNAPLFHGVPLCLVTGAAGLLLLYTYLDDPSEYAMLGVIVLAFFEGIVLALFSSTYVAGLYAFRKLVSRKRVLAASALSFGTTGFVCLLFFAVMALGKT